MTKVTARGGGKCVAEPNWSSGALGKVTWSCWSVPTKMELDLLARRELHPLSQA